MQNSTILEILDAVRSRVAFLGYTKGRCLCEDDLEDLSQDIILKVLKYIDSYNPEKSSLRTWVARITDNCFKDALGDFIRRRQTFTPYTREGADGEYILPTAELAPECWQSDSEIETDQCMERIYAAVESLGVNQRRVISLLDEGVKPGRMTELIGCAPQDVYNWLFRGRNALSKKLGKVFLSEYGIAS